MLASDPRGVEYIIAAQQGRLMQYSKVNKEPTLTKQKTLEVLGHQETLTLKQMEQMKNK